MRENNSNYFILTSTCSIGVLGSDVGQINKVAVRWPRLVLGSVTVSGFNSRCGKFISDNQPPKST